MQLQAISSGTPFRWDHQNEFPGGDVYDAKAVCAAMQPFVLLDLQAYHALTEATYKDIASMIDDNFLNQRVRASELTGIQNLGFDSDTMQFYVNSSEFTDNHIQYLNQIQFMNWDEVGKDPAYKNSQEKARILLWAGDIKLHCTCPSFLYYGYQAILTVLDASIYPELRKPIIRNPRERGSVCKHLNRVLRVLPFYAPDIGKAIDNQFGD